MSPRGHLERNGASLSCHVGRQGRNLCMCAVMCVQGVIFWLCLYLARLLRVGGGGGGSGGGGGAGSAAGCN